MKSAQAEHPLVERHLKLEISYSAHQMATNVLTLSSKLGVMVFFALGDSSRDASMDDILHALANFSSA